MAGSFRHIVTRNGNLISPEQFPRMIETLGDAYEMTEELFGMIWFLARALAEEYGDEPSTWVETARLRYPVGLTYARQHNRSGR